jgi:hypothetical protein
MELEHGPGERGGHFDDRLVGLDLGDGLIGLDRIAFLHEPADDFTFGDSFAHVGKTEDLGHVRTPSS